MSFNESLVGGCKAPFYDASLFPPTGGFVDGRFCSNSLGPTCCLPCPQTQWLYPDNFDAITNAASWINVGSMAASFFLLVSFVFLPVSKTHRHYLSVCLVTAVVFMELGFVIPLGAKPQQCHNPITPNDMKSDFTCAISGSMLAVGGWSGVMWVFLRSLALHLQICWQTTIGTTFMWCSMATGWGIPAIILVIMLIFSGVSFRFGDTCHVNNSNSLGDFWIPLLVFAGMTAVIQFATFGYCIKVYLASLRDDSTTTASSGLPSYANSASRPGTISPRQAYRRIVKVLELQWRGILIVMIIVADVVFFAVIFVFMDDLESNSLKNPAVAGDWLTCLLQTQGDRNACLKFATSLRVNEATVMAVLILLSTNGFWSLLLLGRLSMFTGWKELVMGKVKPTTEFVSADAHQYKDPSSYEMLSRDREAAMQKTPEPTLTGLTLTSPDAVANTLYNMKGRETPDYYGREARYKSPSRSFSAPRGPGRGLSWDDTQSHAQSTYPGIDPLSMNKI